MKRFFKLLLVLVFVGVIIYIAVGYRLELRNEITAIESYIVKDSISVGTGEYGYITEVFKSVGSPVEKGDQLYGYIPLEEKDTSTNLYKTSQAKYGLVQSAFPQNQDLKLKKVSSPVKGILKQIYFPNGSYVTRDDKVMEVQLDSFLVRSTLKMEPKDFELLKSNRPINITLPNGESVGGHIVYIHPEYDFKSKEVIIDSSVDGEIDYLFDGTPVKVVLQRNDPMYLKYEDLNSKLKVASDRFSSMISGIFNNLFN